MNSKENFDYLDELDDFDQAVSVAITGRRFSDNGKHPKKLNPADRKFVHAQDDSRGNFKFTYKAARFEEWWLLDSLGSFYEHRWISDVLKRVKGGKEASVYQCQPGAEVEARYVAAKVYRPRSLRNLKKDGEYRVGRVDLDEDGNAVVKNAEVHAIAKRSGYGEELRHQSWIAYEFKTMETLFEAGADVPRPYAMEKNAILMDYVGDGFSAAPPLNSVILEELEASRLFDRVVKNIDLMLSLGYIHGDLSAYNILYWDGEIRLIDFPQVVLPRANPSSWKIFLRDVLRVCQYFSTRGVDCNGGRLAAELWTARGFKVHQEIDPKHLDPEKMEDREAWEKLK